MFRFKQFSIAQDITPMKVGTDGVLLGAWADVTGSADILDVGTGTGLIAIMAAQRNGTAQIDALEIEPAACREAQDNIARCPWADRITLKTESLQEYRTGKRYGSIICNPPFFKSSTKTPDKGRTMARHDDSLPHPDLIRHSARLLAATGRLSVILPTLEALDFIQEAGNYGLHPRHITQVIPNPGKAPKRFLVSFSREKGETLTDQIIIEISRHVYTPEYKKLTCDFYL